MTMQRHEFKIETSARDSRSLFAMAPLQVSAVMLHGAMHVCGALGTAVLIPCGL